MWAGPAQITGPGISLESSGPISAQHNFFLSFFGPELARPTCKVNFSAAACRNEFCMQQPQRRRRRWSREEKKLLLLAWSEFGGGLVVADERLMAAFMESFGRRSRCGRKKKLVCRGERKVHGGSHWSDGGRVSFLWCSWWWRSWWWLWLVSGTAGRERERKTTETGVEGLVFRRLWTRFFPPSGHEMQPYL